MNIITSAESQSETPHVIDSGQIFIEWINFNLLISVEIKESQMQHTDDTKILLRPSFSLNFARTGVWAQGLMLVWQMLYNLSHVPRPSLVLVIFHIDSHIFPWTSLDYDPPTYASCVTRITVCTTMPDLLVEMGFY
jgi:hypothetical protein